MHGPRILHVATHGFFPSDQQVAAGALRPVSFGLETPPLPLGENPLLRSGLALAGANARRSGENHEGNPWGQLRPYYLPRGNGLGDIRHVSGEFFLSVQKLWRERGDEILNRVADKYPELVFMGLIKLSQVTKVEVGSPGDFAKLGNREEIAQKLEQKAEPEARKLFLELAALC